MDVSRKFATKFTWQESSWATEPTFTSSTWSLYCSYSVQHAGENDGAATLRKRLPIHFAQHPLGL